MQNDKLLKLLEEKKKEENLTDLDREKIEFIEKKILVFDDWVFNLKANTAIGILKFLGVPKEDVMDFYKELTSFDNFKKNVPSVRVSIK